MVLMSRLAVAVAKGSAAAVGVSLEDFRHCDFRPLFSIGCFVGLDGSRRTKYLINKQLSPDMLSKGASVRTGILLSQETTRCISTASSRGNLWYIETFGKIDAVGREAADELWRLACEFGAEQFGINIFKTIAKAFLGYPCRSKIQKG
jgi:hypothetical protein